MTDQKQTSGLSITEFLLQVREGGAIEELRDQLTRVTNAVQLTQKGGKVQLTIEVKPNGTGSVFVKDSVKATVPEPNKGDTLFFVTHDGALSRRDPNQMTMDDLVR